MLVAHEDDLTVPSPYAVGLVEHEGAQHWAMLTEFVEGTSLSEVIEDVQRRTGHGMFMEDSLRIMAPSCGLRRIAAIRAAWTCIAI